MKQILFLLGMLTVKVASYAQLANIRKLKNYPHNASIEISGMKAIISCGSDIDTIPFTMTDKEVLYFSNKKDTNKIAKLKLSAENIADLRMQYNKIDNGVLAKLSLLEQLCNRSLTIGSTMKLVNDNGEENVAISDTTNTNPTPQDFEDPALADKKKDQNTNILFPILTGLLGLALGFILKHVWNKNKKPAAEKNINDSDSERDTDTENKYQSLLQKYNTLLATLQTEEQKEKAYYVAAQKIFVQPVKTALNKNNKEELLKLAMQIVLQYIALCNVKTKSEQGSDNYNYNAVVGINNTNEAAKHKTITQQTPSDEVPNEIKTILQLLADNNIKDIPEMAYFNYIVK